MELHELKDYLDEKFAMNNEVLNEKFTNVNEKFANVNQKLTSIEMQTTKTNGRVNKLEIKMEDIDKESITHIIKCPVKKELDDYKTKMESDLLLFTVVRKYPKTSTFIIGVLILLLVSGSIENVKNLLGF